MGVENDAPGPLGGAANTVQSTSAPGAVPTIRGRRKVIIDTDPGVDDAIAILMAFQSPDLEVIGLTTIFGNVMTTLATQNALHLVELAGMEESVPVAQGEVTSITGAEKQWIADFVHGKDGLGNTLPKEPTRPALAKSGVQFMIDAVTEKPGEITIIALGPLTNLAKACQVDPEFPGKVGEILILGGAFFVNGNVNPASEANIYGDPEAADQVFGCGANISVVGINVTEKVQMTEKQLEELRDSPGPYGKYLHAACQFYLDYHRKHCNINGVFLHDPSMIALALKPSLFTFEEGPVRVATEPGPFRGLTVANLTKKRWARVNDWSNRPSVKVAVDVDAEGVLQLIRTMLMAPSKCHV